MFHCVKVGAIDADVRRAVHFLWRGLVHLSFQAAGVAEVLSCIREGVDGVL